MRPDAVRAVVLSVAASLALAGCASQRQAAVPRTVPSPGAPVAAPGAPSSGGTATAEPTPDPTPAGAEGTSERGAAKTPDEHREGLDRDLDASLAAFDAMLLKEQQEVAAKRAEHGTGGGAAGAAGAGEGGEGEGEGSPAGASAAGGSAPSGATADGRSEARRAGRAGRTRRGADRSTGSSGSDDTGEGGREVATAPEGSAANGEDPSRVPADVGDGRDDDVVARQLREAAMKEEDPRIREKLWDEYRRYKRGGS